MEREFFQWTREVPRGWQASLDALFPRNNVFSWLMIRWWAGERWRVRHASGIVQTRTEAVQRWVIYQMSLPGNIPELVLPDLQGPHPRTRGHWEPRTEEWVSDCNVNRDQWEIYQETGCYAQPFWIIQGDRGGHKRRFTPVETRLLKANGLPGDAPAPGDLPYAELDNRVLSQLISYDRLRWADRKLALSKMRVRPEDLTAEMELHRQEQAAQFQNGMLDWLERQVVAPGLEAATNAAGRVNVDDAPYRPIGDVDEAVDQFRGARN